MLKGTRRWPAYPLSAVRCALLLTMLAASAACAPKGEALYARAEQSLAKGEARAAVIDLRTLVQDEPRNAKARALLGRALVASGEFSAGEIELQKATDLGAAKTLTFLPACEVLVAKGEFDRALADCKPEVAASGERAYLQLVQGRALLGANRAPEAKGQFQAVLAAKPDSLEAMLGLAGATYATDGLAAAIAVLDKGSAAMQARARYWLARAGMSSQGGDYSSAEQAYGRAVELTRTRPNVSERLMALGGLAEAQIHQSKVKEATATAEQMTKLAPNNPMVKQLRAQVAAAAGNLDEARTLLEEVVAAMPKNYTARTLLGIVDVQQGNLGQAEMHFASVVANRPDDVRAQRLLAEVRARLQSPRASLEGLKPALGQEAADPALLAMAGRLSLASGDREQGRAYYLEQASVQSREKDAAEAQLEVASSYLMAGDLDRAVELLEKMPEGGATDLQREHLLMAALLRRGDNDRAVAEANALVQRSGNDVAVRNLVAGVYAAAGQREASREQLAAALKLKPDDPATLLNLARLDLAEGKSADAEKNFRRILQGDPKNLQATTGLAVALGAQGNRVEAGKWIQQAAVDHPESVEAQVALVQFHLGTRDLTKARTVIDATAKKYPHNAAVANARGLVLLGAKDLPGALASFQQAAALAPKAYGYALNLARAHLLNRDLSSAMGVLNGVLKAEPTFVPALQLAAAASLQAGQLEKATGYVERLRQAAPDSPGTFAMEGDLAMAQKRYGEALDQYRKASAKGNSSALVLAQYRAGKLAGVPEPSKDLQDWVAAHPKDVDAVSALAEDKHGRGDIDTAIKLYEKSLAELPGNVVILNNLSLLYQEKGNPAALDTAAKAYEAAPKVAAIQDTYGWLLVQHGKVDKGLELLRDATKEMPNNPEMQYHYAAALAKSGNSAEALPILQKALNGQLPPGAKTDAEKLLQQLSKQKG